MNGLYLFFLFNLFLLQCNSSKDTKDDEYCDRIVSKIDQLFLDYYKVDLDGGHNQIDSALYLVDSILFRCEKYNTVMIFNKIMFLSMKNEFSEVVNFIESLDKTYLLNQTILLNRFKAMQAQSEGDMITRDKLIKEIVTELTDSISKHHAEIDSILCLSDIKEITGNKNILTVYQYYYYRAQIEGVGKISDELDSIQEKRNINRYFFDNFLKPTIYNDFMVYSGI